MPTYDSPEAMLAREEQFISRQCRMINCHQTITGPYSVHMLIYEYEDPEMGPCVRYAIYVNGKQSTGGIVGWRNHPDLD